MGYLYLAIAIVAEVIATNALKATNGFTNLIPSVIVVTGYVLAIYFLGLVLKTIPVGIAYAIWAGLGIVLVLVAGIIFFGEKPDLAAITGIALIVSGVVIINVFSNMSVH